MKKIDKKIILCLTGMIVGFVIFIWRFDAFIFHGFSVNDLVIAVIAIITTSLLWGLSKKFVLDKRLGIDNTPTKPLQTINDYKKEREQKTEKRQDVSENPPQTTNDYEKEREREQKIIDQRQAYYEKQYDFNSIEGIKSIPVPEYKSPAYEHYEYIRMGSLEYYLDLKAYEHKKAGRMDLAIACFRKANEIYPNGHYRQKENVYLKVVECLKDAGRFEEARAEKAFIEANYKPYFLEYSLPQYADDPNAIDKYMHSDTNRFLLEQHKSDLISTFCTARGKTCAECSKYRGRIYSVYGWDSRFPKFPDELRKMYIHKHCDIGFQAIALFDEFDYQHYILSYDPEKIFASLSAVIRYCNRPYIDDRTPEEKALFNQRQEEIQTREKNKDDFDWIREFLPELAPKSLTRYITMKNKRTMQYQEISKQAKEKGRLLDPVTAEDERKKEERLLLSRTILDAIEEEKKSKCQEAEKERARQEKEAELATLDDNALIDLVWQHFDADSKISNHLIVQKIGCNEDTAERFIQLMLDAGRLEIDHYYYDGVPCYKQPTPNDYIKEILAQIDAAPNDKWAFERLVAELLPKNGFIAAEVMPDSDNNNINIIATDADNIRYAIQSKCHTNKLNIKPVQEVIAGMKKCNCDVGVVLTNNYFTQNAAILAQTNGILLWDRDKLYSLIANAQNLITT